MKYIPSFHGAPAYAGAVTWRELSLIMSGGPYSWRTHPCFTTGGAWHWPKGRNPLWKGPKNLDCLQRQNHNGIPKCTPWKVSSLNPSKRSLKHSLRGARVRPGYYGCEVDFSQQRGWGTLPPPKLDQRRGFKSTSIYNNAISGSAVNLIERIWKQKVWRRGKHSN